MKQTSSYYTTDSSSSSEAEDDAQSSMGHPQSLYAVLGVDIMVSRMMSQLVGRATDAHGPQQLTTCCARVDLQASQEAIRTAYRKLARVSLMGRAWLSATQHGSGSSQALATLFARRNGTQTATRATRWRARCSRRCSTRMKVIAGREGSGRLCVHKC